MLYQHFRTVLEIDDPVKHEAEDDILGDIVGDVEGDMDLINEPVTKRWSHKSINKSQKW